MTVASQPIHIRSGLNNFTPDSAKSKIDKIFKITYWVKLKNKQQYLLASRNIFGRIAFQIQIDEATSYIK